MKQVLFLAYHFPPIGGAGAQRPAGLARRLPQLGYECTIVTGPGPGRSRWEPADETLLAGLGGQATRIVRLDGPEPSAGTRWRQRAERWLPVESHWSRWWIHGAVERGVESAAEADLIYAWMRPYETAEAGARLSRRLGKPWVADLGDPWALDEMEIYPTALHRRRELARMRSLLGSADAVVMSTPEAVRRVRDAFPEFEQKILTSSPVGFEGADFRRAVAPRDDGTFRIVHTGALHTDDGSRLRRTRRARRLLGGMFLDVDILTRSHVYLLEAIDRLLAAEPGLAATIEVHFVGVMSELDREVSERSPVSRLHGYELHGETIHLIRTADLLFLPMHDLPPGTRAGLVPGKTYEYLASGRPILAAVPDGDARDLLAEAGSALLCRPSDVAAMAQHIENQVRRWRSREPAPTPKPEVVARYERGRQAEQFGQIFDRVLSLRGTSSGNARRGAA